MRTALASAMLALVSTVAMAQQASPEGTWRDEFGTTIQFSLCGDGTQLCAVLLDVQGQSRTEGNLAYLNQQIMQADRTAENEWKGAVQFDGSQAQSTMTLVAPNTMQIQGCRMAVLCQTLSFARVASDTPQT